MGSCFLSTNAQQVEIIEVVRDDVVHGINVTLPASELTVQKIHGASKSRSSSCQRVVLGGFPVPNKDIVSRWLFPFHGRHPPVDCSLEGNGRILFNVFRMVQQILIYTFTNRSIVVVPGTISQLFYTILADS